MIYIIYYAGDKVVAHNEGTHDYDEKTKSTCKDIIGEFSKVLVDTQLEQTKTYDMRTDTIIIILYVIIAHIIIKNLNLLLYTLEKYSILTSEILPVTSLLNRM